MGLTIWLPFFVGALVCQISGLLQLLVWWHWGSHKDPEIASAAVSRAVAETLRFCTEVDPTTTTTTIPIVFVLGDWGERTAWLFLGLGSIVLTLVCIFIGFGCGTRCSSRTTSEKTPAIGDSSPSDSPVSLRVLARNQLAEIRLRHAHRPNSASGI